MGSYEERMRCIQERREKYLQEYKEYERQVEEERCLYWEEGTLLLFPPKTEVYPIQVCMKKRGTPESMTD